MKSIKYFFAVISAIFLITSCSDDEPNGNVLETQKKSKVTFNIQELSGEFSNVTYSEVTLSLTELNTKETKIVKVVKMPTVTVELNQGSYELALVGDVNYDIDGAKKDGKVGAFETELNFTKDEEMIDVKLVLKSFSQDFLIEEVFFTGNNTPDGSFYFGDKYIKLYNSTDKTLYADGLIIASSAFSCDAKQDYTPNIIAEAFTVKSIIQIPGSGKEYPVEPGASLVIASDGINHIENNTNSLDLSNVDFEMFYEDSDDIDSPVKNVVNLYDKFIFHNRGFESYAIARLPEGTTNEAFITDNTYTYEWLFKFGEYEFPMNDQGVKIPNEWILDAVNLSVESEFKWIVTDTSLDSGWTHCGKTDGDGSRFGKAVRRKVLQDVGGVRLLKDTNNSTNDFDALVDPSLKK